MEPKCGAWRQNGGRLYDVTGAVRPVLRGLEVILQILRLGGHFCGDHGASAPPPSQCSGPIAAWGASEGHTLPLGTCRLGNCTLGKLPLGKLSFGRKLLWESNNKSLIFLYLKTTPIVEELIGAADACQGDSGGPMVTHEGICFLHECGSVIISARQVQTVRWWLSKIVWNV